MEPHEIVATVTGVGGGGASCVVAWLARRAVNDLFDNVNKIFSDLKGLSTKIDSAKLDLKSEICEIEKTIAAMGERIKSLEKK